MKIPFFSKFINTILTTRQVVDIEAQDTLEGVIKKINTDVSKISSDVSKINSELSYKLISIGVNLNTATDNKYVYSGEEKEYLEAILSMDPLEANIELSKAWFYTKSTGTVIESIYKPLCIFAGGDPTGGLLYIVIVLPTSDGQNDSIVWQKYIIQKEEDDVVLKYNSTIVYSDFLPISEAEGD